MKQMQFLQIVGIFFKNISVLYRILISKVIYILFLSFLSCLALFLPICTFLFIYRSLKNSLSLFLFIFLYFLPVRFYWDCLLTYIYISICLFPYSLIGSLVLWTVCPPLTLDILLWSTSACNNPVPSWTSSWRNIPLILDNSEIRIFASKNIYNFFFSP